MIHDMHIQCVNLRTEIIVLGYSQNYTPFINPISVSCIGRIIWNDTFNGRDINYHPLPRLP
jgi:hypothetical protein